MVRLQSIEGEYIFEVAEAQGYDWPFSCRACANCAAILKAGEIEMDIQQILSDEEIEERFLALVTEGSPTRIGSATGTVLDTCDCEVVKYVCYYHIIRGEC